MRHNRKLTATTTPALGSKTRSFLSLQVVAKRLPLKFHEIEKILSGCTSISCMIDSVFTSHTKHLKILLNRIIMKYFKLF